MSRIDYFYFMVDVSNSMSGRKIGAVNDALNNIVFRLKKIMRSQGVSANIILLTYADNVRWSNVLPESVDSFVFTDLNVEGTASNLGLALSELDSKLKRQSEARGDEDYVTTIVLFSDGLSTDEYKDKLEILNQNVLYNASNRIGVTFKSDLLADISLKMFKDFCNSEENIIIDSFQQLNQAIFNMYR